MGLVKIMRAGAEVGLLGHAGASMDLHRAEAVSVAAVAQAGLVVHGEVPRVLDAGALMHEGLAMDRGAEGFEHQQSPGVAGLGGPEAEKAPHGFPEQKAQSVSEAPGAGGAGGLGMDASH